MAINLKKMKRINWKRFSIQKLIGSFQKKNHADSTDSSESGLAERFIEKHSGTIDNNPYLQSRALWLDLYGSAEERYAKSRKLNGRLLILVGLCILGTLYIGSKSKFIPYVVEMESGQVIYTGAAESSNFDSMKPTLARYFIQNFITSARSISVDGYIEKNNQKTAFAFTHDVATTELNDFYEQNDPYQIVGKRTISVDINYVNSLPNNAFEVGWTEISRDSQNGQIISEERYVGEFDVKWDKPSQNEFILQSNPFGFYVTNISWTGVK